MSDIDHDATGGGAMEPTGDERAFGALLRHYRRAAGLSQEALAERAGLTAQAISALERGVRQAPYRDTVQALCAALALAPDDRTALGAAVPRRRPPPSAKAPPADGTAPPPPTGLPTPPDPLLGRDEAVAELVALLADADTRLVTLTGPGGVGKTRLALAAARAAAHRAPGPACFVPLAPLRDPHLVAPAIAEALGLRDAGTADWADAVRAHLAARPQLLVLDNLEHLAPAAALLTDLLAACPRLTILATSRAPLHLRGERPYPVPTLPTPDPDRLPPLDILAHTPAIALFVQRARVAVPGFALCTANAVAIAGICRSRSNWPRLAIPRGVPDGGDRVGHVLVGQQGGRRALDRAVGPLAPGYPLAGREAEMASGLLQGHCQLPALHEPPQYLLGCRRLIGAAQWNEPVLPDQRASQLSPAIGGVSNSAGGR